MLAIIARYQLANGEVATEFCRRALTLVGPTRDEKGCSLYGFARDIDDEAVVWISEEWESEADLQSHLRSDHVKAFLATLGDIEIVDSVSRQYEVSSAGPVNVPTD